MKTLSILVLIALMSACANVSITKTGEGFYSPTKPGSIKILKTVPDEKYIELGTVTTSGYNSSDVAKMHNAIRSKSSALGANAVILTSEGLIPAGWGSYERWATGVAIYYISDEK